MNKLVVVPLPRPGQRKVPVHQDVADGVSLAQMLLFALRHTTRMSTPQVRVYCKGRRISSTRRAALLATALGGNVTIVEVENRRGYALEDVWGFFASHPHLSPADIATELKKLGIASA